MGKRETLLMSPPWTLHLDQCQFESISPILLDSTRLFETAFDFATPESPLYSPPTPQLNLNRSSQYGHKRYLSFPLASPDVKQQPTPFTHSRTMSCMNSHQGLGISMFDEPSTTTLGRPVLCDSAPVSPLSDQCPSTPVKEEGDKGDMQQDELNSIAVQTGGANVEKAERPLTAAEMCAEKRKMKRFRLTHQQTRYLMSEFARQAHPDAAHREKLSRAIPGLSSRQVQVWFQNRRAKLKRVTQDDRDNIVRSRALPENFDLSSALQSPFGLPQRHSAQPVSPTSHSSSSNSDRAARSPVPATTQVDQHHGGLACPFVGTPSQPTADQLSPLPQEICRPFGIFLPTGFQVIEEEVSTSYVLDNTSCPPQAQTPSHQPPPTPQTCDFYTSPLDSSFGSMSPDMNSYGLGFSYGSIAGFQASSIQTLRNHGKHPGKVMIPRKTPTSYGNMPDTPMYSSTTCSPLGMAMGFPILSGPANVTSFPSYIQ